MKLRRVRSVFACISELCFSSALHQCLNIFSVCLVSLAHHSHSFSIRIFDCRRQEAGVAHQRPRPHAHQALKVDCQEVSLRQRMSRSFVTFSLLVGCFDFVCRFYARGQHSGICFLFNIEPV